MVLPRAPLCASVPSFGTGRLDGIRRRLNATGRHVKATDYVGQASRRYRNVLT